MSRLQIYSVYAGDEDWNELLDEFVTGLSQRIDSVQAAIAIDDGATLTSLVHQLRGACGSYGYHEITPLATELEISLKTNGSIAAHREQIDGFLEALEAITTVPEPSRSSEQ